MSDVAPEIVVAHGYDGKQKWVIADTFGEPRKDARPQLKPSYWANLGGLPHVIRFALRESLRRNIKFVGAGMDLARDR